MKSDSPIPMGAMKVPLCFSVANIKIVNTNWALKNISMKRPCTVEVPPANPVLNVTGPGKRAETMAADAMPPRICDTKSQSPLHQGTAPTMHIPNVTAGLKSPPEIRKKTQALTASEKPKASEMYIRTFVLDTSSVDPCESPAGEGWLMLATWVPANAKKLMIS
jgi:hypothetical protein